jgi:hypothetical protein
MAEKRRPTMSMLLKFQGKKSIKIEVFHGEAWEGIGRSQVKGRQLWRVRVNGKWYGQNHGFMYWTDFGKLLMRSTRDKVSSCGPPVVAKATRIRNVA